MKKFDIKKIKNIKKGHLTAAFAGAGGIAAGIIVGHILLPVAIIGTASAGAAYGYKKLKDKKDNNPKPGTP